MAVELVNLQKHATVGQNNTKSCVKVGVLLQSRVKRKKHELGSPVWFTKCQNTTQLFLLLCASFLRALCGSIHSCRGPIEMNEGTCIFLPQCLNVLLQRERGQEEREREREGRKNLVCNPLVSVDYLIQIPLWHRDTGIMFVCILQLWWHLASYKPLTHTHTHTHTCGG